MLVFILLTTIGVYCDELLVTREYTDYLKKHVSWKVADYEENVFRGWTISEAKAYLTQDIPQFDEDLPIAEDNKATPSSLFWDTDCVHDVRNQELCLAHWAFAAADMLSTRCCLHTKKDHGWLSVQELISCDTRSTGCKGGWASWAVSFMFTNGGLVPEACFKYRAENAPCPHRCEDGSDWKKSHVCPCHAPMECIGVATMKNCLKEGPITIAFHVTKPFFSYKEGIFKCDGPSMGTIGGLLTGYSDTPECYWRVKNSWGDAWGTKGYADIACTSCKADGFYSSGNVACKLVG